MRNNQKKLRIGISSPYLEMLGGGERYIFTIAKLLSKSHQVDIFGDERIKKEAYQMLNINLNRVNFLSNMQLWKTNLLKKHIYLSKYDIFFFTTDGSLFIPSSPINYLIIQSPDHIPKANIVNRLKLYGWKVICYSDFMRKIINLRIGKESIVLPPSIDTGEYKADFYKKENIILSVGRFFSHLHDKKQLFLAQLFKKFYKEYFSDWKLVFVGGLTEESGKELVIKLKKFEKYLPIEVLVNLPFNKLVKLYQRAKIYWHATGYDEDLNKYPQKAEHFGITTIEAMAAGTVPVCFKGGGQEEIIEEGKCGYLWSNEKEIIIKTFQLIKNENLLKQLSAKAISQAEDYSHRRFYEKLEILCKK